MRVSPPRFSFFRSSALIAGAVLLGWAAPGRAVQISEYFNDYGTVSGTVTGMNGGTGWSSAWINTGNNLTYAPANQLNYTAPGYANTGNQTDANDGGVSGNNTGVVTYRTFTPLATGTIWLSFTLQAAAFGDVLFWLDKAETSALPRNFVGLRGNANTDTINNTTGLPEPVVSYNAVGSSADDGTNNQTFAINTPHLVLLKIDMNYSGTSDRLSMWVDPSLTGGEAGLGTATYLKSGVDAYGTTFDGIGVSTNGSAVTQKLDSIRISNDADGFTFVTNPVPEPASLGLLALGATLLGQRRRRVQERPV